SKVADVVRPFEGTNDGFSFTSTTSVWVVVPNWSVAVTVTAWLPSWPVPGVPEMTAVPEPVVAKVSPPGRAPVADSVTVAPPVPVPVVEMTNADVVPTAKLAVAVDVKVGAGPTCTTSSWTAVPPAEVAVTVTVEAADVAAAVAVDGVPAMTAVPSPLAVNVSPAGSVPVSASDGVG